MSKPKKKKYVEEYVMHHVHHKEGEDEPRREILISSATCVIGASSNYHKEDIDFLFDRSYRMLNKIKKQDREL